MLKEEELTTNEILNYCIPYISVAYLDINVIKSFFTGKNLDKYNESINQIKERIETNYKIPKFIVDIYLQNGNVLNIENDKIQRNLYFSYDFLMISIMASYGIKDALEDCIIGKGIQEVKIAVNQKLKELRKQIKEFSNEELQEYINKHGWVSELLAKNTFSKEQVVTAITDSLTRIIVNNKYIVEDFSKQTLNTKLFDELNMDKEKFMFYINYRILETCKETEKIDNSIYGVINYFFEKTKSTPKPNISICLKNYDSTKNIYNREYNFIDFSKDLQEYISNHKELNLKKLNNNLFKDCTPAETNQYLDEFTNETLENFEVIDADVIYLPYTKPVPQTEKSETKEQIKKRKKVSDELSLLTLQKRKFFSENKNKIYKSLMGKNKFKGYIAHVFKNGNVIFEKFDFIENGISNKNGAAYIMNIENFNDFSKKSIGEIREYVKRHSDSAISYRCHRGDWQSHLQKVIDEDTNISLNDIERVIMKRT